MNIEELKKQYERLGEEIARLEGNQAWPRSGAKYYTIDDEGETYWSVWNEHNSDLRRLAIGNVFRTKEEAEAHVAKLKTLQKMRGYTNGFIPDLKDEEQRKHYVFYSLDIEELGISSFHYTCTFSNEFWFGSYEDAQRCINEMGDEIKRNVFGVK